MTAPITNFKNEVTNIQQFQAMQHDMVLRDIAIVLHFVCCGCLFISLQIRVVRSFPFTRLLNIPVENYSYNLFDVFLDHRKTFRICGA